MIFGFLLPAISNCAQQKSNAFIEYKRVGGFANYDDHLTIDNEGNATISRKTHTCEITLETEQMNLINTAFDEAAFQTLDRAYLPTQKGGDLTEYTISYQGQTVYTMDSAVPDQLWPIIETLNQVVETCENT
ncbi:MAG: hypothetical protein KDE48_10845 [Anaerolineales bacterium]|nr:hypothetical protein [Anaerolineales bacterium]